MMPKVNDRLVMSGGWPKPGEVARKDLGMVEGGVGFGFSR
jgi:hypothetical protein